MQSREPGLLSRLFLTASLLAGLFLGSFTPASSAAVVDSPARQAPAAPAAPGILPARPGLQPASPAANPLALTIPAVGTAPAPIPDGTCSQNEYSGGLFTTFPDGPGGAGTGNVYLLHDTSNLYMCISSPAGSVATRFDSLYLDPQGNGTTYTYAQQDDFSLRLDFGKPTSQSTFRGNGLMAGWTDYSAADNGKWSGAASTGTLDVAEYKVPLQNFGLSVCKSIFGLAAYHHWFSGSGDDYGWPSNQFYDQPRTWQPVVLGSPACPPAGDIAYVFRGNTVDAASFYGLLTGNGYGVTLVPLSDVLTTDFTPFKLIIIADDTGSLDQWGTPPAATGAAQVLKITAPNRAILGLGEGGYAFFGRLSLFVGWPNGWHGPQNIIDQAATAPAGFFNPPIPPVTHYAVPSNSVGIYLNPNQTLPVDVTPIGMEVPADDHASLIAQGCRFLWGNSGNPQIFTANGKLLFMNTITATFGFNCPKPPPPPTDCGYTIQKTAVPPAGTPVAPGTVIEYTLTYQLIDKVNCPLTGKLVDLVPSGTDYVPGSATDGIIPAGGLLTWAVGTSPAPLSKKFRVTVNDTTCTANPLITNVAELRPSAAASLASTPATTHPVVCQPIGLPNTQPVFAEDELKVTPYPLVAGVRSHLSVRVQNLTGGSLPVTVQFQVAPAATPLGSGLDYSTVATTSAAIPGLGTAVLAAAYVPDSSGNRCFQAVVSTPSMPTPLKTQSCLDLNEDFHAGQLDQLTIVVRNDTSSAKIYNLVVDNTCPGWSASVDPATTASVGPGLSVEATLSVTPPSPLTLGSGCHIDVQVWNGDSLVGGVRKLDLPPVHLPTNITPPWEEPEISFNPDPPAIGVPGQLCIQLQNPLGVSKVVTVNFSVADFGAGIGFVPTAALVNITLPPHSLNTYCVPWTPAASGTLHRCVLATLVQTGALDQHSQRNIDIVRPTTTDLSGLVIPFIVGNPDLTPHHLTFGITLVGIDPAWKPHILPNPPPDLIPGGGRVALTLTFGLTLGALSPQVQPMPDYRYGSQSSVEVTVLLDGIPVSGFTVMLDSTRSYMPVQKK